MATPTQNFSGDANMAQTNKQRTLAKEDQDLVKQAGGGFRGLAASARPLARVLQSARPLAFASEVGVAAQSLLPRPVYIGSWVLSGIAVAADAGLNIADSPPDKRMHMAALQAAFHIPASLVVPALIIHKIVHATADFVQKNARLSALPPRAKQFIPIGAAILSIIPVVPAVDHTTEYILEHTLVPYLGVQLPHHDANHEHEHKH